MVIEENSFIEYGVVFTGFGEEQIKIGKNTYIGIYAVLDRSGGINIGNNVMIAGPSVGIWTHSSVQMCMLGYDNLQDNEKKTLGEVTIENNVYVGGNSTIYPGVTIGHHSVILPNSAVNTDIPSFTMAGGCPVKMLKKVSIEQGIVKFLPL